MEIRLRRTVAEGLARAGRVALLAPVVFLASPASAQDIAAVQGAFEAGRHQEVVAATGPDAEAGVLFMGVLSAQQLAAGDRVVALAGRLTERPETDPWHFVGLSMTQLFSGNDAASALESARRAVALDGQLPEAHYQAGLALASQQDWPAAAMAFERALELNPKLAHAYYYSGLMQYRAGRPDLMATRFEQFLKLAPQAPERPEVAQIMRTVRGR